MPPSINTAARSGVVLISTSPDCFVLRCPPSCETDLTFSMFLNRPTIFGAQLMELITRALAGVVAVWIPIEGAQNRRHVAKAEMSVFTTARSAPKIILLDKKRLE